MARAFLVVVFRDLVEPIARLFTALAARLAIRVVAFLLSPPVVALERNGLHRIAAVAIVLAVALSLVGAFGYLLASEFTDFATQMPRDAVAARPSGGHDISFHVH